MCYHGGQWLLLWVFLTGSVHWLKRRLGLYAPCAHVWWQLPPSAPLAFPEGASKCGTGGPVAGRHG